MISTTLSDLFIVRLKDEFSLEDDPEKFIDHIPGKYHKIFRILWNRFLNIEDILDTDNLEEVFATLKECQTPDIVYCHKYKMTDQDFLQCVIRDAFFDVLVIIREMPHQYTQYKIIQNDTKIKLTILDEENPETIIFPGSDLKNRSIFDRENIEKIILEEAKKSEAYMGDTLDIKW
jgi:hypothetical protein